MVKVVYYAIMVAALSWVGIPALACKYYHYSSTRTATARAFRATHRSIVCVDGQRKSGNLLHKSHFKSFRFITEL